MGCSGHWSLYEENFTQTSFTFFMFIQKNRFTLDYRVTQLTSLLVLNGNSGVRLTNIELLTRSTVWHVYGTDKAPRLWESLVDKRIAWSLWFHSYHVIMEFQELRMISLKDVLVILFSVEVNTSYRVSESQKRNRYNCGESYRIRVSSTGAQCTCDKCTPSGKIQSKFS